ncbi:hypothetical protein [Malonomonas rubra]|uniref:hypothetical protein n=1 Tax=Malonomonas rubra TaxID=57040 RepID=UPI000934C493|nr:hypothetical protein [Malonomonas rubra]
MDGAKIDSQLCSQCGGRCCQGHPGVWSDPQRFFAIFFSGQTPTADQLRQLLAERDIELRDLGGILIPAPKNTATGCIAQGSNGCSYPVETRPCQCLALIPDLETLLDDTIHCSLPPEFGSGTARNNWRPFQPLLQTVASPD